MVIRYAMTNDIESYVSEYYDAALECYKTKDCSKINTLLEQTKNSEEYNKVRSAYECVMNKNCDDYFKENIREYAIARSAYDCVEHKECEDFIFNISLGNRASYEQLKKEWSKCINDGDCKNITDVAAVALGVDPKIMEEAFECFRNRDGEACNKAALKIGATAGCTAITGGAGASACSYLAPIVVDAIWPYIAPVMKPFNEMTNAILDGVYSIGNSIADSIKDLGDTLGVYKKKKDTFDYVGAQKQIMLAGYKIILESLRQMEEVAITTNVLSRTELGLFVPEKYKTTGNLAGIFIEKQWRAFDVQLEDGDILNDSVEHVLHRLRYNSNLTTRIWCYGLIIDNKLEHVLAGHDSAYLHYVTMETKKEKGGTLFTMTTDVPPKKIEVKRKEHYYEMNWNPAAYHVINFPDNWYTTQMNMGVLQTAYERILEKRLEQIKQDTLSVSSNIISENIIKKDNKDRQFMSDLSIKDSESSIKDSESSNAILFISLLIGASVAGYVYKDKIKGLFK